MTRRTIDSILGETAKQPCIAEDCPFVDHWLCQDEAVRADREASARRDETQPWVGEDEEDFSDYHHDADEDRHFAQPWEHYATDDRFFGSGVEE